MRAPSSAHCACVFVVVDELDTEFGLELEPLEQKRTDGSQNKKARVYNWKKWCVECGVCPVLSFSLNCVCVHVCVQCHV